MVEIGGAVLSPQALGSRAAPVQVLPALSAVDRTKLILGATSSGISA